MPNTARFNLEDGRYTVELKNTAGNLSINFRSKSEGDMVVEEEYIFLWGDGHQLQILDGQLAADGVDLGALEPKDKIVVESSGKVMVNGEIRSAD